MKLIFRLNIFAIGLPILLGLAGTIFNVFLFYALLSTMLTGLIQVVLGICLLLSHPKDINLKIYLGSVIAYFLSWIPIENSHIELGNFAYVFVSVPVVLAIYLTLIISKKTDSRVPKAKWNNLTQQTHRNRS